MSISYEKHLAAARVSAFLCIIDHHENYRLIVSGFVLRDSFSQPSPTVQKAKIADDIRSVMTEQAVDWNKGNIDAFMKGYWNSDKLVFASSDGVTRGWQPTLDRYKKSYDSRAKMGTLTFSDLEITVLSKDAAMVLGSWSLAR